MTNALTLYEPAPAIARARAARGYPSLALEWHFAAMERRARMNRCVDIVEAPRPPPAPIRRRPLVLPPTRPIWPIDYVAAHAILDAFAVYDPPPFVTPSQIIMRETGREWGIAVADLVGPRRTYNLARPRQVAMLLVRELTDRSWPDIGRSFGRDHTTLIHGVRVTAERMAADPAFAARVGRLRERIEIALCEHEAATGERRMREGE